MIKHYNAALAKVNLVDFSYHGRYLPVLGEGLSLRERPRFVALDPNLPSAATPEADLIFVE